MNISFTGKGIFVALLALIPILCEATAIALVALGVFEMPIEVGFSLGFAVAPVAVAIIVPQVMKWDSLGYGKSKGIASSITASSTFDNIACLILYGICKTITFQYAAEIKGNQQHTNPAWAIGSIFVHNVAGIIAGVIMGLLGWFFKFIDNKPYSINLKAAYALVVAVGLIIASELSTFTNAKFIACLSFGYTCFRVWGDKKPTQQIADCWFYIQPFLFGTIGASLLFSQVRARDVGASFILIFFGQLIRFCATFFTSYANKLSVKESIFMSIAWIPKSTVPATLAGVIYNEALALGDTYKDY